PMAMEATEEATRVVRTPAQIDVATVMTSRGDVSNVTLDRVQPAPEVSGGSGISKFLFAIVPAAVKPPVKAVAPAAIVAPTAHLGINAFPWATVTKIRNIDSGAEVPMKEA